jgi:hypothetical protein
MCVWAKPTAWLAIMPPVLLKHFKCCECDNGLKVGHRKNDGRPFQRQSDVKLAIREVHVWGYVYWFALLIVQKYFLKKSVAQDNEYFDRYHLSREMHRSSFNKTHFEVPEKGGIVQHTLALQHSPCHIFSYKQEKESVTGNIGVKWYQQQQRIPSTHTFADVHAFPTPQR